MSVSVAGDVFARLVGKDERGVLLFEVSPHFAEQAFDEALTADESTWSTPMQWRFVRRHGHFVELLMREVAQPTEDQG